MTYRKALSVMVIVLLLCGCRSGRNADTDPFPKQWVAIMTDVKAGRVLKVAKSRQADVECRDALQILDAVPLLTAALGAERSGDAVRIVAEYQRRLLCFDVASNDMLDDLLGAHLLYAQRSDASKNTSLLWALMQLGLLEHDVSPSGRTSLWRIALTADPALAPVLKQFPAEKFGLWSYDIRTGLLNRVAANGTIDWLLTSDEAKDRVCATAELKPEATRAGESSRTERPLTCDLSAASDSSPGGRGGQGDSVTPGQPVDLTSCTVATRATTGPLGQLNCVRKTAGLERNPRDLLTIAGSQMEGLPDRLCSGVADAPSGGTPSGGTPSGGTPSGGSTSGASKTGGTDAGTKKGGSDAGTKKGGSDAGTKTGGSDAGTKTGGSDAGTKTGGSDAGTKTGGSDGGTKTGGTDGGTKTGGGSSGSVTVEIDDLTVRTADKIEIGTADGGTITIPTSIKGAREMTFKDVKDSANTIWNKVKEHNPLRRPGPDDDGSRADPCSPRSAAAERVKATYSCLLGDATPPSSPRGSPGDPTRILTTDPVGRGSRTFACLQQGGDQLRTSPQDRKCAVAQCAQDEACDCNRIGRSPNEAASAVAKQKEICRQTVYCAEGDCPCDSIGRPTPGTSGGVRPGGGPPTPPK